MCRYSTIQFFKDSELGCWLKGLKKFSKQSGNSKLEFEYDLKFIQIKGVNLKVINSYGI